MRFPPTAFARLLAAIALTSIAVMPVAAERWQDFTKSKFTTTRLDLDALNREGNLVTYRVEITRPNDPRMAGWRVISNSVIDCSTGMRKHVSTEKYLPGRTVQNTAGANLWRKIMKHEPAAGIRDQYCQETRDSRAATE